MSDYSMHELRKYAQEEIAGYLVATALGSKFKSHHCGSSSDSFDCKIMYEDTARIALEVTADADQEYEELTSSLFSQPYGEALQIEEGLGRWILQLTLGTSIKLLSKEAIEKLIRNCISLGCTTIASGDLRSNHPMKPYLHALGIEGIRFVDFESDIAYRLMPISSGCIDDSRDLLADHLESLLQEKKISDKVLRLIRRADQLQPQLAILVGSNSGLSINFRMNGLSLTEPKPTRPIELPQGLERLWFICTSSSRSISFSPELGWADFGLVNDSLPWWTQVDLTYLKKLRNTSTIS